MPTLPRPAPVHLVEALGDTLEITLEFLLSTGTAEDKSGSTWRGHVRTSPTATATSATFTVSTASEASGLIVATLAAATTAALDVGRSYHWDIEETTSAGAVFTHAHGTVVWEQDVSRA